MSNTLTNAVHEIVMLKRSLAEKEKENKELLQLIHDDLRMRGVYEDGVTVVDLSSFIWDRINKALKDN